MAFLRLLLHCPKLAFLDEASGALDTPTEAALYTALRSHCSSFVSVGELSQAYLFAGTRCLPVVIHARTALPLAEIKCCWVDRSPFRASTFSHTCAGECQPGQVDLQHCGCLPKQASALVMRRHLSAYDATVVLPM